MFYVDQSAKGYEPTAKRSTMLLEARLGPGRVLNADLVRGSSFRPRTTHLGFLAGKWRSDARAEPLTGLKGREDVDARLALSGAWLVV